MEMDNKTKIETKGEGIEAHQKLQDGWASEVQEPQGKIIFLGEYKHSIDDKSRLALPIKYREAFSQGVVITRGLDNCLFAYPKKDWRKLADKISKLPLTQANARAFSRLMLAGAIDGKLDKQGRIILPSYLRQYAALKNKVTIAGVYNRLEIWSRGRWGRYKKNAEENSSEIAENLSELGL
jgi:MraZ protein